MRTRRSVFSEQIVSRESLGLSAADADPSAGPADNPYWLQEEAAPHPDPSQGCIRRGLCCRSSPGWFAPGEPEAAAALLGLEPDAFVRRHLIVDWHEVDGERVHGFAPVKLDRFGVPALPPGAVADRLYQTLRGVCVFFDGAGCGIYAARPLECRQYDCTHAPEDNPRREDTATLWWDAAQGGASDEEGQGS